MTTNRTTKSPRPVRCRARAQISTRAVVCALLAACLGFAWVPTVANSADGTERLFFDRLRERKYYDTAVDFLERLRERGDGPAEFLQVVDLEIAKLEAILAKEDLGRARQHRDAAIEAYQKFLKEHPRHLQVPQAREALAMLVLERGLTLLLNAADRQGAALDSLRAAARKDFEEAKRMLSEVETTLRDKTKLLGEDDAKKESDEFQRARGDLLNTRIRLVQADEAIARTFDPTSSEYTERLNNVASRYHQLYENDRKRVGGFLARMHEANVLRRLGRYDEAVDICQELLLLPETAVGFRLVRHDALNLLLETYLDPEVKDYAEALAVAKRWVEEHDVEERKTLAGLKTQILGARAGLELARTLEASDPARRSGLIDARELLDFVARFDSPYRREAALMLRAEEFGTRKDGEQPTNFAEAKDAADDTWSLYVVLNGKAASAPTEEEREEIAAQARQTREEAVEAMRRALAMRDEETSTDEINALRLNLARLYFSQADYYQAVVLAEFLAKEYSNTADGRVAAEIVVKGYRNLFLAAKNASGDTSFAAERLEKAANYVTLRWPDAPQADIAREMLIDTAVDLGDVETALAALKQIDEESRARETAELRVGRALWNRYVTASGQDEESRPSADQLSAMAETAREVLKQGVDRATRRVSEGAPPSLLLLESVRRLAAMYTAQGDASQAVAWLENEKVGPVALLQAKKLPEVPEVFPREVYMTALQAYVGAQELDKAEQVMLKLDELSEETDDEKAAERLTAIYIYAGRELEQLLNRLRAEGKFDQVQEVSKGFEAFLRRISTRSEGITFASLYWVAETFFSLAEGMAAGGGEHAAQAVDYYRAADETYRAILRRIRDEGEGNWAKPGVSETLLVRLAACRRELGKYEDAKAILVRLLKQQENRVDVQTEAALVYQAWGKEPDRARYYVYAIRGGEEKPDGRNLIWGWNGIARRLARYVSESEQYREIYHEASYNRALCRVLWAQSLTGSERDAALRQAELDILQNFQLFPEMGGPEWFQRYDLLLRRIRTYQGQKNPPGLKEG